jgi:site-specific recombinase XerD
MGILRRYKRFEEVLATFLPEKQMQVTRTTYLGYTRAAFLFGEWLKEHGLDSKPMRKISAQDIADFSIHLAQSKFDKPTCESFIMRIRSVFKYALKRGEVVTVPFDRDLIVLPKKGKDHSAALIPSHIMPVLLQDIKEHDPQLFLACMMEFYCGTRPGREIRLIKVRNFDLVNGILTIDADKSKNGKVGRITMSNDFIEMCKGYGIEGADPDLYVFGKNHRLDTRHLSENMLTFRFNKYRTKYQLSTDVKLYSFKHMGASYLVHSKVLDILELKEHLRHSDLSATQHYVKKVLGDKNEAIRTQFPNPLKVHCQA